MLTNIVSFGGFGISVDDFVHKVLSILNKVLKRSLFMVSLKFLKNKVSRRNFRECGRYG